MEPNKFENNIKEKFGNRTMKPSNNAWDRLSERMDNQPKKQNNKPYWWLGLAASIIGVLLVTTLFFKESSIEGHETIKVVESPIVEETKTQEFKEQNNIKLVENPVEKNNKKDPNKKPAEKLDIQSLNKNNKTVVVDNVSSPKVENQSVSTPKALSFEEQKVQDVISQIQTLKDNNTEVTEAEIESLLLKAQKEINQNKLLNEMGKVDPQMLLADVEAEIDQSFRDKVFQALKDGFGTVKSAVANRNN